MKIFNESPANKSFFITQLRKYHFSIHNQAIGQPHDALYDSIGDKIKKSLPKEQ